MIFSTLMLSALALTACSDESFVGDDPKDWAGTTNVFIPTEGAGYDTYYKPAIGRVGDPMPFYDQKAQEFKVLYLQEFDNNDAWCFHPFYTVSTKDGATYQGLGETLPTGNSRFEQDAALGTGCCVYNEADGLYYIYYTGHNGSLDVTEAVMRATSPDYENWTKDLSWQLKGPDYGFAASDFRDPQIFKGDDNKWHMVISSNLKFAEFVSDNMKDWELCGNFPMIWDRMLECPDIFKMGNYWYLVYSEAFRASWSRKVKYMMADSWEGLKACFNDPGAYWPKDDKEGVLDTRAFYAGKTASDGTNRYIWGWTPFRTGSTIHDKNINVGAGGEPNWSGALVCHKLIQHEDGTLTVGMVPAMAEKFNVPCEVNVMNSNGYANGALTGDAYVLYSRLGDHNHISFTVKTAGDADRFGVSFVRGEESDKYYSLVFNPEWENGRRKVNFEQQGSAADCKWFVEGADGYIFPRPADNTYKIDIFIDNSVVVTYVNGDYGTTQRIYGAQKNCWSINSYGGSIQVSDVTVSQY